jgi:transaldolase
MSKTYLDWLLNHTPTAWWHDSADAVELDRGIERGCVGVTTNPVLASAALQKNRQQWCREIDAVLSAGLAPEQKAEALMRVAVTRAAGKLQPRYEASDGAAGFVCAQVNPLRAGDRECMAAMARRLHGWAPNIAVKLPATAAGLDVLEDCVADGITTTATVSFTVPQVVAIAERHRAGCRKAIDRGIDPGKCFAVIMIGRLDDYLREVAHDGRLAVSEADICQAGLAVTKRAYSLYQERAYQAVLLVAALRGSYHLTELAGADLLMSIHPAYQEPFLTGAFAHEPRIDRPVAADVIDRLAAMPDFVRAYEPDGMRPAEFVTFGVTQRTLSQFGESWKQMESLR